MSRFITIMAALLLVCACSAPLTAASRAVQDEWTAGMEWFKDAKFGVFIHWGIYGTNGMGASWPIFNDAISFEDYMKQCEHFTATKYEPQAWAELFAAAGARYAVLTTKHHDGVALWDTQASDLNVVDATPAGRDLVKPFVDAIHGAGMKAGLYFSWLDWANPDYGSLGRMRKTDKRLQEPSDPAAWQRFRDFNDTQLQELAAFSPDLLWFDGDWGISEEYWDMAGMRTKLKGWIPEVVLNARMGEFGDYDTPEQGIPFASPAASAWELCMTMGPGWGYIPGMEENVSAHIPVTGLIQLLAETSSMGGNLLLNVSPRPDGSIPQWQVDRLHAIGAWLERNGEAVYGSRKGIHRGHFGGPSTLSKDGKTLYLFIFAQPTNGLMIKGLQNNPSKITVLGHDDVVLKDRRAGGAAWNKVPPTRFIEWPADLDIGTGAVVKIELAEPIDLYKGKSGLISHNE
ncbi:MAG: alpha-L-fucosidase [Planctomycetota bacterium]|jgi:alpha-L-fucosidase